MSSKLPVFVIGILLLTAVLIAVSPKPPQNNQNKQLKILKDVGETYKHRFGLTEDDFRLISEARVDIIEGNFDVCASDEDVKYFLDNSAKYNLKVIMPAGSGEAEWGYSCSQDNFNPNQMPKWNKDLVVTWINKWKNHSAIYAWDSSNEAGSVFPNTAKTKDAYLTKEQLAQAYKDIKSADSARPVLIRMNGWFFYDFESDFFRTGNPFGENTADIVMVNAYSNVLEYFPDLVTTITNRSQKAILAVDQDTKIIIALAAWEEKPLWYRPTSTHLQKEILELQEIEELLGIAYFKYGAKNSEWYLPDSTTGDPKLWKIISDVLTQSP